MQWLKGSELNGFIKLYPEIQVRSDPSGKNNTSNCQQNLPIWW